MRTLFVFLAGLLLPFAMSATNAEPDAGLKEVLAWVRTADEFSYKLKIQSYIASAPAARKEEIYTIYSSGKAGIQYMSSAQTCGFSCPEGHFRADFSKRKVGFHQSESGAANADANSNLRYGALVDSVLLTGAKIKSKSASGAVKKYVLAYDPSGILSELSLEYNSSERRLVRMSYKLNRVIGSGGPQSTMVQQVEMSEYKHGVPDVVTQLLHASKDLKSYLSATYPGFAIINL